MKGPFFKTVHSNDIQPITLKFICTNVIIDIYMPYIYFSAMQSKITQQHDSIREMEEKIIALTEERDKVCHCTQVY